MLSRVKLIAEPWDVGPGGYRVGGFPPRWSEWNDHYRDTMRDFWRGQTSAAAFATRLTGSSDLYGTPGRSPTASVDFITAHDGFTLADLVSYEHKHNEANLEENRDGNNDNRSWNCGVEGPTDDPEILALRARQQRNMLATLLLSQGVPMLRRRRRARPHAGRQQQRLVPGQRGLLARLGRDRSGERAGSRFTRRLLALRRSHAVFRRTRFLDGGPAESALPDAWWFRPDGRPMAQRDWHELRHLGVFLNGRRRTSTGASRSRLVHRLREREPRSSRSGSRRAGSASNGTLVLEPILTRPDKTYAGRSSVTLPARSVFCSPSLAAGIAALAWLLGVVDDQAWCDERRSILFEDPLRESEIDVEEVVV